MAHAEDRGKFLNPDCTDRICHGIFVTVRRIIGFPETINEVAARLVAGAVVIMSLAVAVGHQWWVLFPLAYGFAARVLTGPKLSPLGRLASQVVAPRIAEPKLVPGPPKRFAQGMGAAMSSAALIGHLAGHNTVAIVFAAMIVGAATLESVFAYCLGCKVFAGLMRLGIIPESVCEECNNFGARLAASRV
jgi:hypothetical protein